MPPAVKGVSLAAKVLPPSVQHRYIRSFGNVSPIINAVLWLIADLGLVFFSERL